MSADPWDAALAGLEDDDEAAVMELAFELALGALEGSGAGSGSDPGGLAEFTAEWAQLEARRRVRDEKLAARRAAGDAAYREARRRAGMDAWAPLTRVAALALGGGRPPVRVW